MDRLKRLINILKLTPHRQPELVKEATNRILSRPIRTNSQVGLHLKPLIEIIVQYCDNDDSAQRSLFNDYLNTVILTFQHGYYELIIQVLLEELIKNGSPRVVSVALYRVSHLVRTIQPISLGCDPASLLKALIEIARRSEDESVMKALDVTLRDTMPILDNCIRKDKQMRLLANSLVDVLINNLQCESSQTKRLAASSILSLSLCEPQQTSILAKLKVQLMQLSGSDTDPNLTSKFVGFCLCVKDLPTFLEQEHTQLMSAVLSQLVSNPGDTPVVVTALEILKELFKYPTSRKTIDKCIEILSDQFLFSKVEGKLVIKQDTKVILQAGSLACIASIVRQQPQVLDDLESIHLYKDHSDIAVRNQRLVIIGNYIEASWRIPQSIEQSSSCEKVRKLWLELRSTINDDSAHPDTLKSCVIAIKSCISTLLESDHCVHIVDYHDISRIASLFTKSNFKPLKIEILNLFASLNFQTLCYLEKCHWSQMHILPDRMPDHNLQSQITNDIMIPSLIDEHQKIRSVARACLVSMVPNLYVTSPGDGRRNTISSNNDAIVSLASDLVDDHLVVLDHIEAHINQSDADKKSSIPIDHQEKFCIRTNDKLLSSSIIQLQDNPLNECNRTLNVSITERHRVKISTNLSYVIRSLRNMFEKSISMGKSSIAHIVQALYDISLEYPIYQYPWSWDCRPSEYCECFMLLNFLLTYMENLTEPNIVVEDLEVYKNFLSLSHQMLYGLCHESVLTEYEQQKLVPFSKRNNSGNNAFWTELTLKHPPSIADTLEAYFAHLIKLLWLISYIIEERTNPFSMSSKEFLKHNPRIQNIVSSPIHETLVSNRMLFGRVHRKLESSFKSSKKNLNQHDEKFYQILNACLSSMSSLLEFINMNKALEQAKDILGYLKITSSICNVTSLICARQLLKSIYGINIIALYQVDPFDWFEEQQQSRAPTPSLGSGSHKDREQIGLQSVYNQLLEKPYNVFSNHYSINDSRITPASDKALSILNLESRRALKVRRRIEDRARLLFEFKPNQLILPRVRQTSELLKNTITEFGSIVAICMDQFNRRGFCRYQSEILNFMSYLLLLRVNYQKLPSANEFVSSINKLLDSCGEKVFSCRETHIVEFLHSSFTFLILLSYERGLSKPMFEIGTVIQKFDELRAKLSMTSADEGDISTYLVPPLRCLIDDLFIYRTDSFQNAVFTTNGTDIVASVVIEKSSKENLDVLEAAREMVAQRLFNVIENPKTYDLLSILMQKSFVDSSEIKYKKLSQQLLTLIPNLLTKNRIDIVDYRGIELTRRIIENISPEVFQPVNFVFETLIDAPKPEMSGINYDHKQAREFQRWMSLVLIAMHILITQVNEEAFLVRLRESINDDQFVEYLLHIAQLCISELFIRLHHPSSEAKDHGVAFLVEQLASYILYLTHMFQSGLFLQLAKTAENLIKKEVKEGAQGPKLFRKLRTWARDPNNGFCMDACERMFYTIRLRHPDLTIFWCNIMMILDCVDCNRDYWRDLLVYECHNCKVAETKLEKSVFNLSLDSRGGDLETEKKSNNLGKTHINRPSSLNLSDISFSDQLRRSFIRKIATVETQDKALNRNIVASSDEKGELQEQEVTLGNTSQCLSPVIELTRRGALCLVLDYFTISMNDVEHITWLIIHHINDIIRWSHETPIAEFINAVHGNSASSGIFIQAISSGVNDLSSKTFVTMLLGTLERVHYTQYGSLTLFLVEKLLSCKQLESYTSLMDSIEKFACLTVQKLLNETNKSYHTTNDEVVNQLTIEDLDRIQSLLDADTYPKLARFLVDLRRSTQDRPEESNSLNTNHTPVDSESDNEAIANKE